MKNERMRGDRAPVPCRAWWGTVSEMNPTAQGTMSLPAAATVTGTGR